MFSVLCCCGWGLVPTNGVLVSTEPLNNQNRWFRVFGTLSLSSTSESFGSVWASFKLIVTHSLWVRAQFASWRLILKQKYVKVVTVIWRIWAQNIICPKMDALPLISYFWSIGHWKEYSYFIPIDKFNIPPINSSPHSIYHINMYMIVCMCVWTIVSRWHHYCVLSTSISCKSRHIVVRSTTNQ